MASPSRRAFSSGNSTQRLGGRLQRERDEQLQVDAGEVALLDERHRGHLAVRACQVLGDLPPHPAQRLAAALRRSRRELVLLQHYLALSRASDVGLDDPPVRPRALQRGQIDAELLCEPANEGRGLNAVRRGLVLLQHKRSGSSLRAVPGVAAAADGGAVAVGADLHEHGADRDDVAFGDEDPDAPCRRQATGSRPSSCRSGSRRAGRPRRSPGPRPRATGRSRPPSTPRPGRAA